MDFDAFRPRVEAVAATGENAEFLEPLETWQRAYRGDRE